MGERQRLRLPPLERLALADLALRRNATDEEVLLDLIRQAVRCECAKIACEQGTREGSMTSEKPKGTQNE